jgi:hypothetical protein
MLKRIPLFCQETGYSEKAVARKIEDGVWVEGREYVRAPDGRLLIDMDGFNRWALGEQRWVEKQQAAVLSPANAASESGSRGAASAMADAFTSPELTTPNERMKCSS